MTKNHATKYLALFLWIFFLLAIGYIMGTLTQTTVYTWYGFLKHSPLTPPHYVFSIAWTGLYILIGICGWLIWRHSKHLALRDLKIFYLVQLFLNWSWTPLFFGYHFIGASLAFLIGLDVVVGIIIYKAHSRLRWISLIMMPYLLWILFATYLNFYIWLYN